MEGLSWRARSARSRRQVPQCASALGVGCARLAPRFGELYETPPFYSRNGFARRWVRMVEKTTRHGRTLRRLFQCAEPVTEEERSDAAVHGDRSRSHGPEHRSGYADARARRQELPHRRKIAAVAEADRVHRAAREDAAIDVLPSALLEFGRTDVSGLRHSDGQTPARAVRGIVLSAPRGPVRSHSPIAVADRFTAEPAGISATGARPEYQAPDEYRD